MKVALVTTFPQDPDSPHGGVEAVSVNLTRALARLGDLDVHVVTTDRACDAPSQARWENATVHRLPWVGRRTLTHATGPGRRMAREYLASLRPDVVHAHDFYGLMTTGMPVARVFTIHGFIHADTRLAGERFSRLRSWLWRRAELACWAEQPHIVSISPYVRERLAGVATGVIHDIENPISEVFFDVQRRERPGTVFSAAYLGPRKNTLGLLEAFGSLISSDGDARLRLAGAMSDPHYASRVREAIRSRGLESRVAVLGKVGTETVREELAAASVFALVSFEEGAPMVVAEAMAAGVPVVASNRCGMPYMVRDGETGFLVDPEDPADVALRLRQLLEDDALRARMGAKAREVAQDRFHPDRVARRTAMVYHQAGRSCGSVRQRVGSVMCG